MGNFFSRSSFSTPAARQERFSSVLADYRTPGEPLRILDLGCGSGEQLLALARRFPQAELVGVDISLPNVETARAAAARSGLRVQFVADDFHTWTAAPFDVVVSDSVLQNIPDSRLLLRKLADQLKTGGLLLVAIPYDGPYNRLLWAARRVARLLAGPALESFAMAMARRLHPELEPAMLHERLGYLYLLPYLRDSAAFRHLLANEYGLELVQARPLPHASLAQPKHRLLIFQRKTA